jgi:hypothetical protein
MAITYVPPDNHVVRYVPWARLRKDENDIVVGVVGAAFRLRDDEEYLSATWLEFFSGSRQQKIEAAVKTVRASKIDVRPLSGFAIGQVERIKSRCLADRRKYKIRVIHEKEEDNTAHTALRQWPRDNDDLLDLLAADEWSETVLNKNIPA